MLPRTHKYIYILPLSHFSIFETHFLDPLFELKLSDAQALALEAIATFSTRSYGIQRRMLDILSTLLLGTNYSPPGSKVKAQVMGLAL